MRIRKPAPTKKSVVQPEDLLGAYSRLSRWAEKNIKGVLWTVAAVLLMGAVIAVFGIRENRQNDQASALEAEAGRHYNAVSSAPGVLGGVEYGKALALYRKIVEQYSGTRSAPIAEFYMGNAYRHLRQWDKAVETYESFIRNHSGHSLLPFVQLSLGYTHLEKGDFQKAIAAFQSAVELKSSPVAAQAIFEIGRSYEFSNNPSAAREKYEALRKSYPTSPWAQEAAVRINQFQKEGG